MAGEIERTAALNREACRDCLDLIEDMFGGLGRQRKLELMDRYVAARQLFSVLDALLERSPPVEEPAEATTPEEPAPPRVRGSRRTRSLGEAVNAGQPAESA